MLYIKGIFLSAEAKVSKSGYKFTEVAVANSNYPARPYVVQFAEGLDYKPLIDKEGYITIPNIFVSAWNDTIMKYSPVGVKLSVNKL